VKISAKTALFVLFATAMGFAETPTQLGDWSIYPANGTHARQHVVLLQSTSETQLKDAEGNAVMAKLDIICKGGKLSAVALEPGAPLLKSAITFTSMVPATRVLFVAEGKNIPSEKWSVLDGGRTLAPHSELMQGKLMRLWIERISSLKQLGFQLDGNAAEKGMQPQFATAKLSEALSSVGCSY
jgi:hypothetical protein